MRLRTSTRPIVLLPVILLLSAGPAWATYWHCKWEVFGYDATDFDDLDFNEDGTINAADEAALVGNYGSYTGPFRRGDLDLDHDVDYTDLGNIRARLGRNRPSVAALQPETVYALKVDGQVLGRLWAVDESTYVDEYFGGWDQTQYHLWGSEFQDADGSHLNRYICHDFTTDRCCNTRRDGGEVYFGHWEGASHAVAYLFPAGGPNENPLCLDQWAYVSNSGNNWWLGDDVWSTCQRLWLSLDGWLYTYGLQWSEPFEGYPSLIHWNNSYAYDLIDQRYLPGQYDLVRQDPQTGTEIEYFDWQSDTWQPVPEPGTLWLAIVATVVLLGWRHRQGTPQSGSFGKSSAAGPGAGFP
ncbi:MAG: hypothetical protein JXB62_22500 [Pirellulales bacterium]|nr:hypothetical protein [Pirellulales bacterium]